MESPLSPPPAKDALAWARRRAKPIAVRCKDLGAIAVCDNITDRDPRPKREVHITIEAHADGSARAEISLTDN